MRRFFPSLLAVMLLLAGCTLAPPPRIYILGGPMPDGDNRVEHGLPMVDLRTVALPDYLDSTDILRRHGANEMVASPTGRWGERLSFGLTDSLANALSQHRRDLLIGTGQRVTAQTRLFVEVTQFDIGEDGICRLSARWRTSATDGKPLVVGDESSVTIVAKSTDDAGVAAAMSAAVDQLAARIAPTL
jgi:uncharacterized lipoprotein YmbA